MTITRFLRGVRARLIRQRLPGTALGRPLGEGFEMRPLTRAGLDAIVDWLSTPDIRAYFDFGGGRDPSRDELTLFLCARSAAVACVHAPGGEVVGCYAVIGYNGPFRTATGLFLRRPGVLPLTANRDGAGAVVRNIRRAALEFIFDELGVMSLNTWTVESNRPAILFCRNLGMQESGRMRSAHVIDGRRYDRLLFSMTAGDYAAIRAARGGREAR